MEANAPWRNEELLRQKYIGEGHSTRDLASLWDCDRKTISNWLDKFDVPTENSHMETSPWQDKKILERLYIEEELTCGQIGNRLGCSGRTVDKWRRRYGIKSLYKQEEWLNEQFNERGLYISEIADKANCKRHTISKWLDELGVRPEEDRPADYSEDKPWKNEEELEELYHGEELSAKRVSDKLGCSQQTVRHWLIQHGIDRRPWWYRTLPRSETRQNHYETVTGSHNGEKVTVLVHRLVAVARGEMTINEFHNPDMVIHHRTNIPWDNRPKNLTTMTREDHMRLHAQSDYKPEVV